MNAMLDPRAFIPFLYDPATLSLLQQQQAAALAAQSKSLSLPTSSSTSASSATSSSFRIHDLLESARADQASSSSGANNQSAAAAAAALAQIMGATFSNGNPGATSTMAAASLRMNICDRANSSGENDSLLDDLDGNHSSRSSSAGTPPLHHRHDRSSGSHNALPDRSSNCSSSASVGGSGGPMHSGKKARKARTIFTDKQLQELETTFERQKYLSVQDRVDLAHRMGLSDTQVKTWYQNRRTKWKRQAAVGVDLLHEASNMAAVQNLLRTNPYWTQYLANHAFAQQRLCQAGIIQPGLGPNGTGFAMMFPPGMMPPTSSSAHNGSSFTSANFSSSNMTHEMSQSPNSSKNVKSESVSPPQESYESETNDEKSFKKE